MIWCMERGERQRAARKRRTAAFTLFIFKQL